MKFNRLLAGISIGVGVGLIADNRTAAAAFICIGVISFMEYLEKLK